LFFRLASSGSDKMIKLWGREGDDNKRKLLIDFIDSDKNCSYDYADRRIAFVD